MAGGAPKTGESLRQNLLSFYCPGPQPHKGKENTFLRHWGAYEVRNLCPVPGLVDGTPHLQPEVRSQKSPFSSCYSVIPQTPRRRPQAPR